MLELLQEQDLVLPCCLLPMRYLIIIPKVLKNKREDNDALITHEYFIDKSKQKYTNLVKEGSWIKTEEKKQQQVVFAT